MRKKVNHVLCLLAAFAVAGGCVERTTELTAAERAEVADFTSEAAPTGAHEMDVSFENKVLLVGYEVDVETITPGEPFTITWHWKCERPLEDGWLLFTHIADAAGTSRLNSDGESTVRRLYQPGRWKAGEYVRDVQRITIPADWNSTQATFFVGVWNGPHRLQVVRGPNDGENRARALSLPVAATERPGTTPAQPSTPTARATRTDAAITIDGRLDEAAWASAVPTAAFVQTMTGGAAEPGAKARLLWNDESLFVAFEVQDDFLKNSLTERDAHLWEQDCVEIMVDPDGDGRNYFEMQVSPTGAVFDTRYDARRVPQPFGHVDWQSGLRSAVVTQGTANDDEADEGYVVEIAIPWTAFAAGEPPATRPEPNATWRMNFFVMDLRRDGQRAVGWSPPRVGDFHALDRFGRVHFFDPSVAAPAPQGPAGGPGAEGPSIQVPPTVVNQLRQQLRLDDRAIGRAGPDQPGPGEEMPTRENPDPGARRLPTKVGATVMGGVSAMTGAAPAGGATVMGGAAPPAP